MDGAVAEWIMHKTSNLATEWSLKVRILSALQVSA